MYLNSQLLTLQMTNLFQAFAQNLFPDSCVNFNSDRFATIATEHTNRILFQAQDIDKHFKNHPDLSVAQCYAYARELYVMFVDLYWAILITCIGRTAQYVVDNDESHERCELYYVRDSYQDLIKIIDDHGGNCSFGKRMF